MKIVYSAFMIYIDLHASVSRRKIKINKEISISNQVRLSVDIRE